MVVTFLLSEIDTVAQKILEQAGSKTLLFYGEMGAGKTTLIKSLVRALGAEDAASSPTFSLVNEYSSPEGPLFHFDFYRIEDETEALDMGIEDYLETAAWKFIEWPQKIENILGQEGQKMEITIISKEKRLLNIC